MSKLNVDQKTIKDLFQNKHADFLIPDYQRPYAWGESECQTLWDDIQPADKGKSAVIFLQKRRETKRENGVKRRIIHMQQ